MMIDMFDSRLKYIVTISILEHKTGRHIQTKVYHQIFQLYRNSIDLITDKQYVHTSWIAKYKQGDMILYDLYYTQTNVWIIFSIIVSVMFSFLPF